MKALAIIFAVLICVYAVFSLVSLVMKFVQAKKKRAELTLDITNHDGAEEPAQTDTTATE